MATAKFSSSPSVRKVKKSALGVLWFNQDVAAAVAAYVETYGRQPTTCVAHPMSTVAQSNGDSVLGLRIERRNLLLPHHLHIVC